MHKNKLGQKNNTDGIFIDLPKPLSALDTTIQGGSLKTAAVNKIRHWEKQHMIHHFIIPFKLDDDEYVIDVKFKVKLRTESTIGIPGMP
jgi:hypothetical protein